jgi:hypothetical protein
MVFMGMSSLLEGCTRGANDKPHWRELEGAWTGLLGPTAASCCAAKAWSFSSVGMPTS